jgi:mannose-6-phosphate isomerase-like protein (cupin superfamily)
LLKLKINASILQLFLIPPIHRPHGLQSVSLKMQISVKDALTQLNTGGTQLFAGVMEHGTMSVEIYRPDKLDHQAPHRQDELYVIISGSGEFLNGGARSNFSPGDVLFAAAGVEHRFENFTDDFTTWVIFYGPPGGEK